MAGVLVAAGLVAGLPLGLELLPPDLLVLLGLEGEAPCVPLTEASVEELWVVKAMARGAAMLGKPRPRKARREARWSDIIISDILDVRPPKVKACESY